MSVFERPPAEEHLALLGDDRLEELLAELLLGRVGRGEERARRRSCPGSGSVDAQRPAARREELVGDLDQDARAVAGVVLAAAGAAVVEVHQRRQAVADELVRLPSLQVDDEADAAAVVLVLGS